MTTVVGRAPRPFPKGAHMTATKTATPTAMQTYITSVEEQVMQLMQGRCTGPLWLQALFGKALQEALNKYRQNQSCTVGMYLWGYVITPPAEADKNWKAHLTAKRSPIHDILAAHKLTASRRHGVLTLQSLHN